MRALRAARRLLGWLVLGLSLTAATLLLTALLVVRTEWGHRQLRDLGLRLARDHVDGSVRIGHLGGGVLRDLVLEDVEVRDREGNLALAARRLEARYDLTALLGHTLDVSELRAEGLVVRGRRLGDGRFNLATLLKPTPPSPRPLGVELRRVVADVDAHVVLGDERVASNVIGGRARLEGAATVHGSDVALRLAGLDVEARAPVAARLQAHGGAHLSGGRLAADHLALTVEAEGAALRRLLPSPPLRGRWRLSVDADGPPERLQVTLRARPPAGEVTVAGTLSGRLAAPAWQARLDASGLDPGAAVVATPRGTLAVRARGAGVGGDAAFTLERLDADLAGVDVEASGALDRARRLRLRARVRAADLGTLARLGAPPLAGRLSADVDLERAGAHTRVDLDAHAAGLRVSGQRARTLEAHVHALDLTGKVRLRLGGVVAGGHTLDTLAVDASGDRRALELTASARGPRHTHLEVAAHGTPLYSGHGRHARWRGAVVTLDRLALGRDDVTWAASAPAGLRVERGGELVSVDGLALASGRQRLALDGRYQARGRRVQATLHAHALDLSRLGRLVPAAPALPATRLDFDGSIDGPLARPRAEVAVRGWSAPLERLGLGRVDYDLAARLAFTSPPGQRGAAGGRLDGRLAARSDGQALAATFDVPLTTRGEQALALDLTLENARLAQLRALLPARLATLDGRVDARLVLDGTTRRPRLDLDARGASLRLGDSAGTRVRASAQYRDGQLGGRVDLTLQQHLSGSDDGQVVAEVALPLALAPAELMRRPSRLAEVLEHTTPLSALLTLRRLDLGRFPYAAFGLQRALERGSLDGALRLDGTLHAPRIRVDLEARGLQRGHLDHLDLFASLAYADSLAQLSLDGSLRGLPLVRARGHSGIDFRDIVDGRPWRNASLRLGASVPSYRLERFADQVPHLAGSVDAELNLAGTLAAPTADLYARVSGLVVGAMGYERVLVRADYDGVRLRASLGAADRGGGLVDARLLAPRDPAAPIDAALRAVGFAVDIEHLGLTEPRLLRGRLDADVTLRGPRATAALNGRLRFSQGQLSLASDPRIYRDIEVRLVAQPGLLTLERLAARLGDGSLAAHGRAELRGLQPQKVELDASARRFAILAGSMVAWLDADVKLRGAATPNGLRGTATVEKGSANLPKVTGNRKLQSTDPLADVTFVDAAARREQRRRQGNGKRQPMELTARVPGPFKVRSKELNLDLKGDIDVTLRGGQLSLDGEVQSLGGWFELVGRRYNIERARVAFTGDPDDPELDVRLSRQLTETMLVVEVHGTARKPRLDLRSDPPIYDQAQVISAILSGDPTLQRTDDRSLDQKVTGAISSFVIGKIKDQIAPHLPLDVIKIDTGTEGAAGLADTRLELGKYLTDSIYVSYVHQFGNTIIGTRRLNSNQANVEWRFYRHYELQTSFGDAAVGRVDLYWMLRF